MKATQSEEKSPGAAKNQRAQDDMKAGQKEKSAQDTNMKGEKSAQDTMKREQSKGMSSENEGAKGKDMKAEGREGRDTKTNAQGREDRNTAQGREDRMNAEKNGTSTTTTTGQAGAGAKLAPEQRTKITSVIREQHVQSINHVNFEIRPGVRVTRELRFYPLPQEVVTIYPQWRGYEFILVKDKIVVVDPQTLEIVDVLDV